MKDSVFKNLIFLIINNLFISLKKELTRHNECQSFSFFHNLFFTVSNCYNNVLFNNLIIRGVFTFLLSKSWAFGVNTPIYIGLSID